MQTLCLARLLSLKNTRVTVLPERKSYFAEAGIHLFSDDLSTNTQLSLNQTKLLKSRNWPESLIKLIPAIITAPTAPRPRILPSAPSTTSRSLISSSTTTAAKATPKEKEAVEGAFIST
eukprot:TRINITY_DN2584_c0_g1_i4.p1 TRINITY_DN2584_c0_g1~~TRINITY_DN2584_c0_g1_i4.p1  ORF type:complete len:119 (-),score=21.72 TRINITY_DN2584_c0_g1_i4:326-682(-)